MKLVKLLALSVLLATPAYAASTSLIPWQSWQESQFTQAQQQHKLILLDVEAVWCHWCHVMDNTTYQDADVARAIAQNYIAVKVDHDARPDLAERYRDYGWPATVILDAAGRDIVKRAGYIEPAEMLKLLQKVAANPAPEADEPAVTTFANSADLSVAMRRALLQRFWDTHDRQLGGLQTTQKYLDRDTEEYALLLASQGQARARKMVRLNLDAGLNLLDPVWGGVYQYSTHSDWQHPHFEKLAYAQAGYLRLYALAARSLNEPKYLQAALAIRRYMRQFLTAPDGSIYSSQDADLQQGEKAGAYFALNDKQRRALGIPRVDTHVYAKTNGAMIAALTMLYSATGQAQDLTDALTIANNMIAQRQRADGGFGHDSHDVAGPYLADNLAMGQGFIALFEVTGDAQWLHRAWALADYINTHFRAKQAGYVTAVQVGKLTPVTQIDENIVVTRWYNQVYRYGGRAQDKARAEYAMRYLATPQIALSRLTEAGILSADFELANVPAHLTVVGAHSDNTAVALYQFMLRYPLVYRRIDWWDPATGKMDNPDVTYPDLGKAAAFVCAAGRCSTPAYQVGELQVLTHNLLP